MTLKYVITEDGAIVFDENVSHVTVGHGYKEIGRKIYSAGFVKLGLDGLPETCFGKSESLKIESKPVLDIVILKDLFCHVRLTKYGLLNIKEHYE